MSDPFFDEMEPAEKLIMFYNWLEDRNDRYELAKQHGILVGSFTNPEAAKKMSGEGGTTFKSTEADFEESTKIIKEESEKEHPKSDSNVKRKRKRKLING